MTDILSELEAALEAATGPGWQTSALADAFVVVLLRNSAASLIERVRKATLPDDDKRGPGPRQAESRLTDNRAADAAENRWEPTR